MNEIYYLSEYNWVKGFLVSEGKKNFKILTPGEGWRKETTSYVAKEKCAKPDELVCVVWETWKGRNGRGGYRVERTLYPDDRVAASNVHYQTVGRNAEGRVTEKSYGVKD